MSSSSIHSSWRPAISLAKIEVPEVAVILMPSPLHLVVIGEEEEGRGPPVLQGVKSAATSSAVASSRSPAPPNATFQNFLEDMDGEEMEERTSSILHAA